MEIEDKRVLITGSSRGLGRALVTAFVDAGAQEVLAGARKPADLEALKSDRVTPVQLDVTNEQHVNAVAGLGAIDILVNNAGVAGFGNPLTMDFEKVQEELAVNYLGVLRVTRAVAPGMIYNEATQRQVPEEVFQGMVEAMVPLRRAGTSRDMYGAIRWLCSDDAAFVTGQVISPNGGSHARF